jgi:hypothetical protein
MSHWPGRPRGRNRKGLFDTTVRTTCLEVGVMGAIAAGSVVFKTPSHNKWTARCSAGAIAVVKMSADQGIRHVNRESVPSGRHRRHGRLRTGRCGRGETDRHTALKTLGTVGRAA